MKDDICPKFEKATKILNKRWNGLIIHQLLLRPKRFGELEDEIQISGKVLSTRLKELEEFGIVERKVYPETPVRIEYDLSQMGKSLSLVMKSIEDWSKIWL
ncbi:helix-turn-helix transcriptional regulator [Mycoplasmatota bacterium]|nr:helix-turn-helix transcriptional regulator [Mycoplasmatota bacterium]